jgi:hypothetical protein
MTRHSRDTFSIIPEIRYRKKEARLMCRGQLFALDQIHKCDQKREEDAGGGWKI